MHTTPPMPLLLLLLLLLLLGSNPRLTAPSPFSTVTMAKASSATIICGLLPSPSSPLLLDLNCTAAAGDHSRHRNYPSPHPFSALAGGEDFLCAIGPSSALRGDVAMRWWNLSAVSKNRTDEASKRVYVGPPLEALSSGGYRVCGVLAGGELHCWRWHGLSVPAGLRFTDVAVGAGFVCGILANSAAIRCFGNDTEVVGAAPQGGSYDVVAAAGRHACALSTAGELSCWGSGAPQLGADAAAGFAALALGEDSVCGLRINGTVHCFGESVASPPGRLAEEQYVDIHSQGPCVPMESCQCGVLPGSANLCAGGGCICVDCAFELNASPKVQKSAKTRIRIVWIAVAAVAFLLFLVALQLSLFFRCRRRRGSGSDEQGAQLSLMQQRLGSGKGPGSVVEHFALAELHEATDGFSDERRIGSGSFGSVYRGTLADGRDVAIKRGEELTTASSSVARPVRRRDRESAFFSELTALSRANHKNIVCLLGCCADLGERVLVYEFMANGTLHDQLHKRSPLAPPLASWHGRLTIALAAARGIEYMHTYAVPPIIHRDIKSANILLDDSWTAKIADFGLSSILTTGTGECGDVHEPLYTGGTVGYMDPEYYRLQHLTEKSDVYSFGVVLLELMTGCRVVQRYAESVTPKNVVDFAVPQIVADEVGRVLDPRLPPPTPAEADALNYVGYLAADCVGPVGCDRPTMTEVVDGLERAVGACAASPVSQSGTVRRALSRSGTDQFELTDTD